MCTKAVAYKNVPHMDVSCSPQHMTCIQEPQRHLYESDVFRMFCYKVVPCADTSEHDWTACPFVHPGEKARRRCPLLHNYQPVLCQSAKKGTECSQGDACTLSHNLFEVWLHPSRYRTQLCTNGANCKRAVCFFAHDESELRKVNQTGGGSEQDSIAGHSKSSSEADNTSGAARSLRHTQDADARTAEGGGGSDQAVRSQASSKPSAASPRSPLPCGVTMEGSTAAFPTGAGRCTVAEAAVVVNPPELVPGIETLSLRNVPTSSKVLLARSDAAKAGQTSAAPGSRGVKDKGQQGSQQDWMAGDAAVALPGGLQSLHRQTDNKGLNSALALSKGPELVRLQQPAGSTSHHIPLWPGKPGVGQVVPGNTSQSGSLLPHPAANMPWSPGAEQRRLSRQQRLQDCFKQLQEVLCEEAMDLAVSDQFGTQEVQLPSTAALSDVTLLQAPSGLAPYLVGPGGEALDHTGCQTVLNLPQLVGSQCLPQENLLRFPALVKTQPYQGQGHIPSWEGLVPVRMPEMNVSAAPVALVGGMPRGYVPSEVGMDLALRPQLVNTSVIRPAVAPIPYQHTIASVAPSGVMVDGNFFPHGAKVFCAGGDRVAHGQQFNDGTALASAAAGAQGLGWLPGGAAQVKIWTGSEHVMTSGSEAPPQHLWPPGGMQW